MRICNVLVYTILNYMFMFLCLNYVSPVMCYRKGVTTTRVGRTAVHIIILNVLGAFCRKLVGYYIPRKGVGTIPEKITATAVQPCT